MTRTPHEFDDTPLASALSDLPAGEPPADLEARIIAALPAAPSRSRQPAWLPNLLAAAAVLVILAASQAPRVLAPRDKSARAETQAAAKEDKAPALIPMAKAPRTPGPWVEEERARDTMDRDAAKTRGAAGSALAPTLPPTTESGPTPGYGLPNDFGAPATPWRDGSGERQQVTRSQLEIEVPDVEDAYDEARDVLTRSHAVVLSHELRIAERGKATARIQARVPLDQVDGVTAQLRDLGKVLLLSTDSQDRTRDYYGKGATIRDDGETEKDLVRRYEAERNPARKQQLLEQIESLRQRIGQQKVGLEDLSEQTHSVLLDITLTGRRGPFEFLSRAIPGLGQALLWVLVSSVFWAPLLLAAWLVRRRGRAL